MRSSLVLAGLLAVLILCVFQFRRVEVVSFLAAPAIEPTPSESGAAGAPMPSREGTPPPGDRIQTSKPPWIVEGGPSGSHTDALEDALVQAQRKVRAYLHGQNPSLEWVPSLEYIQKRLVKPPWKEELKEIDVSGVKKTTYIIRLEVAVSDEARHDMLNRAREYLVQQRMIWLAKILAGLVVLLAAVAGYLRLDESTKGYYTGWLRLAAVSLIGAAGIALLYLA